MSYIHPQKSTLYNIYVPTISLTHPLYVMSMSVWLIPLVSLPDPHIYVIYTSTEVHQIQYMYPYYITDLYSLCHVKVSLTDSPGQSAWSPHLCHIYIQRSPHYTIYMFLLYHWHIPCMSCQYQSGWFPWSVCLIPTSMSYIHPQKYIKYNICIPTISLTYILYVMSRSVWLIPLVSLPDPHIYVIYTSTEVHIIQYMSLLYHWPIFSMSCQGHFRWFPWSVWLIPTSMSYIHPQKSIKYNICVPTISLTYILYVMSRSVWLIPLVSLPDPHIYVIYTSREVHTIQYICPYYITDTSPLCHVKVSLADSPGQSAWSPHLCHIYIHRSTSNTIYVSLLYHWPIFSMSCQGQSGWFPWSVCLIPTSMSYIHPQKSTKYNIYVPTISLTYILYVMSRSLWLIPQVSLSDPHIYVIYTSTEVHIIQYMYPYYITDLYSLCHVKVTLADSPGQSGWSPHLCHIYIHRSTSNTIYVSLLYQWPIFSMSCQSQSDWFPGQSAWSPHLCHIYIHRNLSNTIYVSLLYHWPIFSMSCQGQSDWFPGQSAWSPHLCHIYIHRNLSNTIYVSLLYHWPIFSMSCQGQSDWFPWSVCLIPTSMSYIHPQKSIKYNICVPIISLTYILYVMSMSVWLIPLVSLPDPHIYVIYTSTEVNIIQYMYPYYITDLYSLCHVKVTLADSPGQSGWSPHLCHIYIHRSPSNTIYVFLLYHWVIPSMSCQCQSGWFPWSVCLIPTSMSYIHPHKSTLYNICVPTISLTHPLYVMSRSVWLIPLVSLPDPHIYVIYTSTEVHQIQYMYPYYITDTSHLCHVKVSLTDSPGQSAWSPHLCHIYIHRSLSNTIYVSLLYHWPIFSMSCQGQSDLFPWSVCLIPTSMSYIHPEKSTLYNIYVPTISLTHPLFVMSRSHWLIPLVSLPDPHIYVIYTSTEVHQIQYMYPYYITDLYSLCHVKVSLTDSLVSLPDPHIYVIYTSTEVYQIQYMCPYYITDLCSLCHVKVSLTDSLVSLPDPHIYVIYTSREVHTIQYICPYYITDTSPLCHVKVSLTDSPGQSVWSPHLCHICGEHPQKSTLYNICVPTISLTYILYVMSRSIWLIPWSVFLIPTSMSYKHPQKSIKYNIYVPTISLTHPMYVMSRSVWLIPLVSLPDPHIYVIYTSTEVHIIQYMCPYYITDT